MMKCHQGMMQQHARAAVAHDFLDFFSFGRSIAVDGTDAAKALDFHARAFLDALHGISGQCLTLWTEFFSGFPPMMMSMTVYANNGFDRLLFLPALFFYIQAAPSLLSILSFECSYPQHSRKKETVR